MKAKILILLAVLTSCAFGQSSTPSEAIKRRIFSTGVSNSPAVESPVNVQWFGAKGNGVTDDSAAVQAAVTAAAANNLQTIFFPPGTYYFASSVVFSTAGKNWRLTGVSAAGYLGNQFGAKITGANGLGALFLFSASNFGLEVDHLSFDAVSPSTGVVSAIKSTSEGSPARPVNIHNCHFLHFDKAIYSLLAGDGTNTGICQVNIRDNTFYGGNYALYGAGDAGSVMDLNFEGNVSEGGAKIFIGNGGAGGTLRIVSNIMEGQSDAIDISAGLCEAIIESNYFEQNSGYLVRFIPSNGRSSLRMAGNYYLSSNSGRIHVENCTFTCRDLLNSQVYLSHASLTRYSGYLQNRHYLNASETNFGNVLDVGMTNGQDVEPASLSGTLRPTGTGNFSHTPYGMRSTERFTTTSSAFSVASDLAVNDWVIVTAFVRQVNSTAQTVTGAIYDNTVSYLGESTPMNPFEVSNDDRGWKLVHFGVKVSATSTGNYRIRFSTEAGGQIDVADFFAYKTTLADNTAPIYVVLPSSEMTGLATLLSGNTSVIVTHGMIVTPSIIHPTPQKNVGGVYVDTIGATQFTIKSETAAPSDTIIMWSAR